MHNSQINTRELMYIRNAQEVVALREKRFDAQTLDFFAWRIWVRSSALLLFPNATMFWDSADGVMWPLLEKQSN